MKTNGFKIVLIIVLVLLFVLFILTRINNNKVRYTSINEIDKLIKKTGYSLFYKGEVNDDINNILENYRANYKYNVYILNDSFDKVKEYIKNQTDDEVTSDMVFIMYSNDGSHTFIYNDMIEYYDEYIKQFDYNYVPTPERNYKLSSASQFKSMVAKKDYTIAVFGEDSCSFCNMLEPIVNDVAKNKKLDIYYYNSSRMDADEYQAIMEMDIAIPAECTTQNVETSFLKGFAKPMTLVLSKNKVVGCIKGFYEYNEYVYRLNKILEAK
jgi:thiol-disulfide isomerase/thioredoxin